MQLHHLSDDKLLTETDRLVRCERDLLAQVLHHLREIERRRLFSALGYPSLFRYATDRLGYPEDQAHRRISAMRLLREMPELEEKIESGALNLTQIGLARAAFKRQEFSREEKLRLLEKVSGKTSRDAEAMIAAEAPLPRKPEKIRAVASGEIQIQFTAPATLREKIETLRGRYAHSDPGISIAALFEKLCDLGLEVTSKEEKKAAPRISQAAMRRAIFGHANSRCEKCGSTYALEIDHRQPLALAGSNMPDNLRILCRSCNQRAAIEAFGPAKMERYL